LLRSTHTASPSVPPLSLHDALPILPSAFSLFMGGQNDSPLLKARGWHTSDPSAAHSRPRPVPRGAARRNQSPSGARRPRRLGRVLPVRGVGAGATCGDDGLGVGAELTTRPLRCSYRREGGVRSPDNRPSPPETSPVGPGGDRRRRRLPCPDPRPPSPGRGRTQAENGRH